MESAFGHARCAWISSSTGRQSQALLALSCSTCFSSSRMRRYILGDLTVATNLVATHKHGACAESHAGPYHAMRSDVSRGLNLR
jgi:hypothetical protein